MICVAVPCWCVMGILQLVSVSYTHGGAIQVVSCSKGGLVSVPNGSKSCLSNELAAEQASWHALQSLTDILNFSKDAGHYLNRTPGCKAHRTAASLALGHPFAVHAKREQRLMHGDLA